MVAGIVQEHMDQHHQRIQCFDCRQQRNRPVGIDRFYLDHPGGFKINRTVNVDALTATRLVDGTLGILGGLLSNCVNLR